MSVYSEPVVADITMPVALRLRGYVTIPTSGNYSFDLSGTGASVLMVGADGTPFSKITAASQVSGLPTSGEPFALEAGQRIYVEIIQIQTEAGPNLLDWGWIRPDGVREAIPAELWESFTLRDDDADDNGLPDSFENLDGIAPPGSGIPILGLYGWAGDFNQNGFTNLQEYAQEFYPTDSSFGENPSGDSTTPASILNGTFEDYAATLSHWDNDGYYDSGFNWNYLNFGRLYYWRPYTGDSIELWSSGGKTFCELAATRDGGGIKQRIRNPAPGSGLVLTWSHRARSGIDVSLNDYTVRIYSTDKDGGDERNLIEPKAFLGLPGEWTPAIMNFTVPKNFDPVTRRLWIAFIPSSTIGAGTLIDDVVLLPVEIETNYVDRDDPVRTWTTAGAAKKLPIDQPIYAGKETGDLVSWRLAPNITSLFNGGTYMWTAERKEPAFPAVTVMGVMGVDKTEWKLVNPLDWKPGTYKIKCSINKDGNTTLLEFEQRVGVRTDDIVVIGWIDPAPIPLVTAGVQPALLSVLPEGGLTVSDGDNSKLKAGLLIKHIAEEGVSENFELMNHGIRHQSWRVLILRHFLKLIKLMHCVGCLSMAVILLQMMISRNQRAPSQESRG